MLSEQLALAEAGYKVFPIVANAKRPITAHGLKDATTDAEQIERWTQQYPGCNWGLRCDGMVILDIDGASNEWFANLGERAIDLAVAPISLTPNGGKHFLFKSPDANYSNTQGTIAPKVDTRANEKGYIVVAPSSIDGKRYQWATELDCGPDELPTPPQWLIESLTKKPTPAWKTSTPGKITEGQRNAVLFRFGCALRRPGASVDEIAAALHVANQQRCNPPLEPREVDRIAQSAADYQADAATMAGISGKANQTTKPIIFNMNEIQEQETEWLWENHIPIGELTCIAGMQGLGKSFLTIDIAARLSTGKDWPLSDVGYVGGGDVILLSGEDDPARTIKPRLRAAGANLARVHVIQGVQEGDSERDFSLEEDLPALEQAIEQTNNCKLVIIDPISCYTGKIDDHVNKEVRAVLKSLRELAVKHRVAIVFVTHLNRSESKNALNRISGSGAFTAAPRMAWIVAQDPNDEEYRVFVQAKANIGPNPGGLTFRIVDCEIEGKKRGVITYSNERTNITASEALDESGHSSKQRGPSKIDLAMAWLSDYMSSGPQMATAGEEAAKVAGHSAKTLGRARNNLNVLSRQIRDGERSCWQWHIPDSQAANPDSQPETVLSHAGSLAA